MVDLKQVARLQSLEFKWGPTSPRIDGNTFKEYWQDHVFSPERGGHMGYFLDTKWLPIVLEALMKA